MHSLRTKLSKSNNPQTQLIEKRIGSSRSNAPMMKSPSRAARDTCITTWRQRASYYYDASHQTGKTFRQLVKSLPGSQNTPDVNLGYCSNSELLVEQTHFFLNSLRPFVMGATESKINYLKLLQMHLSTLAQPEREALANHLRQVGYECQIAESAIDDEMYLEYGFCNGPPHTKKNILLSTSEFFKQLDTQPSINECEKSVLTEAQEISITQAKNIRNQLSICTSDWVDSDKTPQSLLRIARHLERAVTGYVSLENVSVFNEEPGPGKVIQQGEKLLVDLATIHELKHRNNESLFAVLLRDMLEIFLTKKIVSSTTNISHLSAVQKRRVWNVIETIQALAPTPSLLSPFRTHVKTLLKSREIFGKVHIIPASGVALGHAWITPSLSITPDHQKLGVPAGTCYLHSGARLHAGVSTINEWPIQWLTATESENVYPSRHAWHLAVPVPAKALELAAQQMSEEWKRNAIAYRFVAVAPDSPATGCRMSVWTVVEKGMDADTKLLFAHFNRGLALPDSTIELWERLNGFMQWLELIANDDCHQVL
jgi:hypothetical protein